MKKRITMFILLMLSALLCGCGNGNKEPDEKVTDKEPDEKVTEEDKGYIFKLEGSDSTYPVSIVPTWLSTGFTYDYEVIYSDTVKELFKMEGPMTERDGERVPSYTINDFIISDYDENRFEDVLKIRDEMAEIDASGYCTINLSFNICGNGFAYLPDTDAEVMVICELECHTSDTDETKYIYYKEYHGLEKGTTDDWRICGLEYLGSSNEKNREKYANYDWGKEVLIDEWETKKWTPVYED